MVADPSAGRNIFPCMKLGDQAATFVGVCRDVEGKNVLSELHSLTFCDPDTDLVSLKSEVAPCEVVCCPKNLFGPCWEDA